MPTSRRLASTLSLLVALAAAPLAQAVDKSSPLSEKAAYLEQDLKDKHSLDGLYVSIVPVGTAGRYTVNEGGNVIHAGVWTGRYLAGVGYQYAVTQDPKVREHGWQILKALRIQQEVTGKPGLLARGYVKGHGPVAGWERDGSDSKEWHQGQGPYADYRWYGDVSVDNFNAVLYGYAIYYDLAADEEQKKYIAHDVDRLMTHLLDNNCRIVDVDDEVTEWGHVGQDPDPARDDYYKELYSRRFRYRGSVDKAPLRSSLMLLPDLLIASHITGNERYGDFYKKVVERYKSNPEPEFSKREFNPRNLARVNHSSEGQAYEALYNLIRYETNPELLAIYRPWVSQLWDFNWMEGNSVFTYMTLALLPEMRTEADRKAASLPESVPHAKEALALANDSLGRYPVDRVLRPVMNSLRKDLEFNEGEDRFRRKQAAKPLPIDERPLDNEYAWKGSPYELDGWLKPTVVSFQVSCDDPQVAWFCDSAGRVSMTVDRGQSWQNMMTGLMGAVVQNLVASKDRTFVLWAQVGDAIYITRDGGMSWRKAADSDPAPAFATTDASQWIEAAPNVSLKIDDSSALVRSTDGGKTSEPAMTGWRIPVAKSLHKTPWGIIAGGPGGTYRSDDGSNWEELPLWQELETGAADYLHAYWMGRYYGFVPAD